MLGAVLLCLPATVFAEPLDTATPPTQVRPAELIIPDKTQIIESPHLVRNNVAAGREVLVSIGPDTLVLEPNAPHEIFLDEISLGTYTSDYNGQLFVQVKIPAGTTPGPHQIQVKTPTQTIQKSVQIINN